MRLPYNGSMNEASKADAPPRRTILLMGPDADLGYLLNRFAEQSEYQLRVTLGQISFQEVTVTSPAAVIFATMDFLGQSQGLVAELASLEVPILVCAGVVDQVRAGELGADACLLHPITLDGFRHALTLGHTARRA